MLFDEHLWYGKHRAPRSEALSTRDGPRYEHACSCISHDGGQPRGRRITSPQVMGCNAATCAGSLISRGLPNGKLDITVEGGRYLNPCCCYCTSLPLNSSLPLKRSLKMKSARFEKASEEIGVPRGKKSERYRSTPHYRSGDRSK